MYDIILKSVENIPEPLKTEIIAYFLKHVLKYHFPLSGVFRKKPELYKIAEDIIRLRGETEMPDFNTFSFSSSTVRKNIQSYNGDVNTIQNYISDSQKYIEIAFHLKTVEKLINIDKRRYAASVIMSVLSIIGGIVGAIIGTAMGEEGLKHLLKIN
jgi:hypothetical protein